MSSSRTAVPQKLIDLAVKRTGHRAILVGPVVHLIAERAAAGHSARQIEGYLQGVIGPRNAAAQHGFVSWVLRELRQG
ncbi:hypothetical protein [Amycolatopsis suaedae]|uniref:Uncharacterized protein n=1 Tax=Amycolatopsis suaedae TaxID=2510978 RepID=A0A4V2ELA2_9PSEU|nr:hypothetical protein [Amycolatopsis suaedae]RZQ60855.1 hypothetical protein EWH70_27540 [Amycolatopsis suaedae]